MRVKICGITNLQDAMDAIEAGADALGFLFYEKSPRYITPQEARKIIEKLPPFVQSVGLFVNCSAEDIDRICEISKVDIAQIHFEAEPELYNALKSKYIKVVRAASKEDILQYNDEYRLIDAFVESYGGEGKRIALEWFDGIDCSKIILAGGLTPDNLKELEEFDFYGVDVSSGVERSKGKKEKSKMIDFVKAVARLEEKKKQTISKTDQLSAKLLKYDLSKGEFLELLMSSDNFYDSADLELELLLSNGFPLKIQEDIVSLNTKYTPISEQIFCIVDIETTAGNPNDGQIIELGAIKIQNGQIIDRYESLVSCAEVPHHIERLTSISSEMLINMPSLKSVLEEFKIFLEDAVFVAHDIKFDYKFISESFKKFHLGELANRKLCTIDLAKRTIDTHRYGLEHLKDILNIDIELHHRAMSDALSTFEVFKKSLEHLPQYIKTTEELIKFSKSHNVINK